MMQDPRVKTRVRSHWCIENKCKKCGRYVYFLKSQENGVRTSLRNVEYTRANCMCNCHKGLR